MLDFICLKICIWTHLFWVTSFCKTEWWSRVTLRLLNHVDQYRNCPFFTTGAGRRQLRCTYVYCVWDNGNQIGGSSEKNDKNSPKLIVAKSCVRDACSFSRAAVRRCFCVFQRGDLIIPSSFCQRMGCTSGRLDVRSHASVCSLQRRILRCRLSTDRRLSRHVLPNKGPIFGELTAFKTKETKTASPFWSNCPDRSKKT